MSRSEVVVCPFYSEERALRMRMPKNGVCDNLRSGIPLCVLGGLFPDWDEEFEDASMRMDRAELEYLPEHFTRVECCGSVVLSDVYDAVKCGCCFFGGICVSPAVRGFAACSVNCSRWRK